MSLLRGRKPVYAATFYYDSPTSGGYWTVPHAANMNPLRTDSFSIVIWFRSISAGALCAKQNSAAGTPLSWYIRTSLYTSGDIYFHFGGSGGNSVAFSTVAAGFNDGEWHCVIVAYGGTSTTAGTDCYVDGVLQSKANEVSTLNSSTSSTNLVTFGARQSPTNMSLGYRRDFAYFDYKLSAADALAISNRKMPDIMSLTLSGAHPLRYYRMNNSYADTGSSPGADATPVGYSGRSVFRKAGPPDRRKHGSFLRLNGTSQYATMAHDASLTFAVATPYTIVAWASRTTASSDGYLISKIELGVTGWGLYITSTGGIRHNQTGSGSAYRQIDSAAGSVPSDGQMHLIVASYDGSNTPAGFLFSVDNRAKTSSTTSNVGSIVNYGGTLPIYIGARTSPLGLYYGGDIAWVAVYAGVLTAAQKTAIYAAGPFAAPPTSDRLLTSQFADPAAAPTVPSFPADATLVNSPAYGAGLNLPEAA